MEFACRLSDEFGETPFDGSMNVFVGGHERKPTRCKLLLDSRQPIRDGNMLFVGKDSHALKRFSPGATALHILERHALVYRQGGVQIPGVIVEFSRKASAPEGHTITCSSATFESQTKDDIRERITLRHLVTFEPRVIRLWHIEARNRQAIQRPHLH